MKSTHTPGPWQVQEAGSPAGVVITAVNPLDPAYPSKLEYVGSVEKKNAALVAAAPELLAVLREWVENAGDEEAIWFKAEALLKRIDGDQ